MRRLSLLLLVAWSVVALSSGSASAASTSATRPHTIFDSAKPATVDSGDPHAVELGVKFTAAENGTVTGVRFYKASTNTGTHIGTLWTSSGAVLAEATFTDETASGWQTVNFATPASITAGVTYVAGYYDPRGHYSRTIGGLGSAVRNGPLTAIANTASANGVFTYASSSSFPVNAWHATNYYVDVDFVPASSTPAASPAVPDPPPAAAAPASTAAPAVTGTAMQGDTLTSSAGAWSGSPTTYRYQWTDCTSSGASCVNITGATSSSYRLGAGDVGDTVRAIVTASNTAGSAAATSAPTGVVAPPPAGGVTCNLAATTSNYSAVIASAAAGQTVCLASGDYSAWAGYTGSTCCVTVTAAPGAAVTFTSGLALNLSTVKNVTLDGTAGGGTMTIGGELDMETSGDRLQNKALNLTFQNITFLEGSNVVINGPENANIVFNDDTFTNGNADDSPYPACNSYYSNGAQFYLTYSTSPITTPSGVTIDNSTFSSFAVDQQANPNPNRALESGAPLTIEHSVIEGYLDFPSCNHIDGLQLYGGGSGNVTFVGNMCVDDFDCLGAFDVTQDNTITDNVCYDIEDGCFELYSDTGSVVNHNTMMQGGGGGAGCLTHDCTSDILLNYSNKSIDPPSTGGVYENNIGNLSNDGTLATDTNNLFSGAGFPNINGIPRFAGGTIPTTWAGFELALGSPGHLAATDGTDVGVRASAGFPPGG